MKELATVPELAMRLVSGMVVMLVEVMVVEEEQVVALDMEV